MRVHSLTILIGSWLIRRRTRGWRIDAATGNHIWAERYDRDLSDTRVERPWLTRDESLRGLGPYGRLSDPTANALQRVPTAGAGRIV